MSDLFEDKNISPMLLQEAKAPFDDPDCIYELKLDGIRCIAYLEPRGVTLQNKRHKDVTTLYPELRGLCACVQKRTILDGELVVLRDGKPDFYALQRRSLLSDPFKIELASRRRPVQFAAYDILYYDGADLTDKPLTERKAVLREKVKEGNGLSLSRFIEERGIDFFALTKAQDLEGIVAKKKDGRYRIGKRTSDWIKIKVMQDEDLRICGFLPDEYGRPKDLILGYYDDEGALRCRGKVYLGVRKEERDAVAAFAARNTVATPWFDRYKDAVWLKPALVGTVRYMHETESGGMRQPVWKGLRE